MREAPFDAVDIRRYGTCLGSNRNDVRPRQLGDEQRRIAAGEAVDGTELLTHDENEAAR